MINYFTYNIEENSVINLLASVTSCKSGIAFGRVTMKMKCEFANGSFVSVPVTKILPNSAILKL